MMTSRTYHSLHLDIATYDSSSIIYLLVPHRRPEDELVTIEEISTRFGANIVVVSGMDWNNDMTPWQAPAVKEGVFGGHAAQFLERLKEDLFFNLEISLKIRKPRRSLVGVSLSGLFAVWSTGCMPLFEAVGSVSGSLWYDGFLEWMKSQEKFHCERYYFSLGNKEKEGKNKRLASVEEATLEAVDLLKSVGKVVTFEYTEGNHFGLLIERLEKAINGIYTEVR